MSASASTTSPGLTASPSCCCPLASRLWVEIDPATEIVLTAPSVSASILTAAASRAPDTATVLSAPNFVTPTETPAAEPLEREIAPTRFVTVLFILPVTSIPLYLPPTSDDFATIFEPSPTVTPLFASPVKMPTMPCTPTLAASPAPKVMSVTMVSLSPCIVTPFPTEPVVEAYPVIFAFLPTSTVPSVSRTATPTVPPNAFGPEVLSETWISCPMSGKLSCIVCKSSLFSTHSNSGVTFTFTLTIPFIATECWLVSALTSAAPAAATSSV